MMEDVGSVSSRSSNQVERKKKKEAMAEIKKPLQGDLKITLIQLQQECGACFTQSAAQCHYCNSH